MGTIFTCDSNGNGIAILKSFESAAGKNPSTELCKASNGKFYGMTYRGGKDDYGILYEWDPVINSYAKKLDLATVGYWPSGALVEADNGKLYGMTQYKGAKNQGVLFEFDPLTNKCSVLHEFNEEVNGKLPLGALVKGTAGRLYGTTRYGGKNGKGVLFEWNTANAVFTKKFDFDNSRGSDPRGLMEHTVNGKFYGLTWSGGTGSGVLYEWDPANNVCKGKANFNGIENGGNPMGHLIQAQNGKLYGMTYSGGSFDRGVIFEWDPVTNIFIKVFDFKGAETGYYPYGSLTEAGNHKIYGMTAYGGLYDMGVLFAWDPASNVFSKKLDFNDINGAMPHLAFANMDNGNLLGTTFAGGPANAGVLFEWNPDTDEYIHKFNFESDVHGYKPMGSLVQTINGSFYGMTSNGGEYQGGVIFELDPQNSAFIKKYNFSKADGNFPAGSLILASSGKLYGMTKRGGSSDMGVIFEWDPMKNVYSKMVDFKGQVNGSYPDGSLLMAGNGRIYGVTGSGGERDSGVLFEWNPVSGEFSKKCDFYGRLKGSHPTGSLIQANNGKIYGITANGGDFGYENDSAGAGTIFEWDPVSNVLIKKFDFNGAESGTKPSGSLVQGLNGKLYGMTFSGGTYSKGVLFEWDPNTDAFTKKLDFNGEDKGELSIGIAGTGREWQNIWADFFRRNK